MKTTLQILSAVGAATALGAVGFAVYFDYRRRNDPVFRKQLKKQKKLAAKQAEQEKRELEQKMVAYLQEALELVKDTQFPTAPEAREKFFMENLQLGETHFRQDPTQIVQSAVCFFKAVKVYPNPVDLLVILQKSVPEEIVGLVYAMVSTEVHDEQRAYFEKLTARFRGLAVQTIAEPPASGQIMTSAPAAVLHATDAFPKGRLLFMEEATVACLRPSVLTANTHCHGCMCVLENVGDPDATLTCPDCLDMSIFCSAKCLQTANKEFHRALCPQNRENPAARLLWNFCVEKDRMYPLMVARFLVKMIWKQVVGEMSRVQDSGNTSDAATSSETTTGKVLEEWEHLEKMKVRRVDVTEQEELETQLVRKAIAYAAPGAEEFLTVERYVAIKGGFLYNSYGLPLSALSDSKVSSQMSEPARSAHAPAHQQIGAALYFVGSYLAHSEQPNVELGFSYHESKQPFLVVKAARDIEPGEQLSTRFVPEANKALSDHWQIGSKQETVHQEDTYSTDADDEADEFVLEQVEMESNPNAKEE